MGIYSLSIHCLRFIIMTRPRCAFRIRFCPKITRFKPEGVLSADMEVVKLTAEEAEAMRLKDLKGLDQTAGAAAMRISQSTFQRLLTSAHQKVSEALLGGKAIIIK